MDAHNQPAHDYSASLQAASPQETVPIIAEWVAREFECFYATFREVPAQAQRAFERGDHRRSLQLSSQRLSLYSDSIIALGDALKRVFPAASHDQAVWDRIDACYMPLIEPLYEADVAIAYFHSVRRWVYQGEWWPVEYSFGSLQTEEAFWARLLRVFPGGPAMSSYTVIDILRIPDFESSYRDLSGDAAAVAERVNETLAALGHTGYRRAEMVNAGLFRNRGGYLVGRLVLQDESLCPFIIALLNEPRGIYVDAVLTREADAHNMFSSTLANFHVTNDNYHELSEFLFSIMPQRPLGLHYSTIGYNHLGKVAVMNELRAELFEHDQVFEESVGFKGTVAIGFSAPTTAYHLKVIRNHPTEDYKWGEFEGLDSVLRKYSQVHEINRTGSMLDNIIYHNLKLDHTWFDPVLAEELLNDASESVSLQDGSLVFKNLIVQRLLTPLPVFLENASAQDAHTAIVNLGFCIKNNAAANIYNKDLDARNYGVSRHLKVYLFDYDALEPFVDIKIRSNADRIDGEEDVPDWFFEDGEVFLPEEIEVGLRIHDRSLRRLFREVHGDLYTVDYWERVQRELREGKVPSIRVYPESSKLKRPA